MLTGFAGAAGAAHEPDRIAPMTTALALLAITTALAGMMLAIVWSLRRCGLPGVGDWWRANLLLTAAMILITTRGFVPDVLSVLVANVGLAWALALFHVGVQRFCGRPPPWRTLLAGTGAVAAGIVYWRYVDDDVNARVLVVSVFHGAVCMWTGLTLWRNRPRPGHDRHGMPLPLPGGNRRRDAVRGPRAPWIITAGFALLFAVGHGIRGMVSLDALLAGDTLAAPGFHPVFLAVGALVMPAMTMGAVLMIHGAIVERLEAVANTDYLTGVLSRKAFEEQAARVLAFAEARGMPVALLIVDVDHFKVVNDTHGHAAGDAVLTAFSAAVADTIRQGDLIGRLGGEEFAVLLPGASDHEASRIAERVRAAAAAQMVRWHGVVIPYTVSGGLASWQKGEDFAALAARADTALYVAKLAGRNRTRSHEEMTAA